jgi:hypothetical protein
MSPDEGSTPGLPELDKNPPDEVESERDAPMRTWWRLDFGWKRMGFFTRLLLVCAAALLLTDLVVQVTGIQLPFIRQQTQQDRERAVQVMQEELALLPPYPGSAENGRLAVTSAGHGPSLDVDYASPGQCRNIQTYYTTAAPAAGWILKQSAPSDTSLVQINSIYQKTVDGFTIMMAVTCYTDPKTYGSGYLLNMRA